MPAAVPAVPEFGQLPPPAAPCSAVRDGWLFSLGFVFVFQVRRLAVACVPHRVLNLLGLLQELHPQLGTLVHALLLLGSDLRILVAVLFKHVAAPPAVSGDLVNLHDVGLLTIDKILHVAVADHVDVLLYICRWRRQMGPYPPDGHNGSRADKSHHAWASEGF